VAQINPHVCHARVVNHAGRLRRERRRRHADPLSGESAEYRAARDGLLEREVELRRAMEAVAVARRALPPGGAVPEDYLFAAAGPDGTPIQVRLAELFALGKDSLVIYNFMFPRATGGRVRARPAVTRHCCRWRRARARLAPRC
jgi:predicted dithiol-disulfide oxidoreductase (DUF899 family)